ncbi:hypothetical protein DBP26_013550 [Pseudomonas sp. RIT409]|nr:hypothetical protein DBP26_013550 [Pseudomonas sp. RIT 409]
MECRPVAGTRFMQFGEPDVITFILAWCALSLMGTLFALSLIKMGKRRQPDAEDLSTRTRVARSTYKH